jgi:hypothetical protein
MLLIRGIGPPGHGGGTAMPRVHSKAALVTALLDAIVLAIAVPAPAPSWGPLAADVAVETLRAAGA